MTWPFGKLIPFRYGGILIDPPWKFELWSDKGKGKSPDAHYETMTLEQIAALPVQDLATPNAIIAMWATSPLLNRQIRIMEHWGFTYLACMDWQKVTAKGLLRRGPGYRIRTTSEFLVIGKLGEPPLGKPIDSSVIGVARQHSRKPDAQYDIVEALAPDQVYCEVFATQRIGSPHWHHFGNQLGKYRYEGRPRAAGQGEAA